jgi:multidrug efflux pump subunit AcrA (membrane-fusion protein)
LLSAEAAYCTGGGAGSTGTPTPTSTPVGSPAFCSAQEVPLLRGDVDILTGIMNNDPDAAHAAQAASLLAANTAYLNAQSALAEARQGPSSEDIAIADAAVTAAQQSLDAAEARLAELNAGPTASALATAQENVKAAQGALTIAQAKLAELNQGATQSDKEKAQEAVVTAAAGLAVAQAKLNELNAGATESELQKAQDTVDTAAAALTATQAKVNETYAGSTPEEIALQRNQLQLAQLSVKQAQKNLEGAKLVAPFDGTVAALNVEVGEVVGGASTTAPIVLNTPNAVRLNLTITESDLPNVKAGQSGTAVFDALEGSEFPIVIDSVGVSPTTTQGVVTYQVRARFVTGTTAATTGAATSGAFAGRAFAVGGTPVAGATPPAGVPGANAMPPVGTPVAGATPPAGAGAPGANAMPPAGTPVAGATPAAGVSTPQATATSEAKPLPGMNATVTITVEQAQNVLVVPDRAIQTEGRNSVVEVQKDDGSTETVVVQTGLSDGTNTEVMAGLEEGQTVILPSRAVTTTSAQATPSTGTQGGGFSFPGGGDFRPPGD